MRSIFLASSLLLCPSLALAAQCPAPTVPEPQAAQPRLVAAPGDIPAPRAIPASDIAAIPALKRITSQGATVMEIGNPVLNHGLRGIYARNGNAFRVFYLTPDGDAEIGGVMWDAGGRNITRDTVAPIPGAIPTVTWKPSAHAGQNVAQPMAAQATEQTDPVKTLASSSFGLEGRETAPRLYMILDPLCPYSTRAFTALQPYIERGDIQLGLVPIAINDYENAHASTPAAIAMLSAGRKGMGQMWHKIMAQGHAPGDIAQTDSSPALLQLNMAAAHSVGLKGTPTFVWADSKGMSHVEAGLPDDLARLVQELHT